MDYPKSVCQITDHVLQAKNLNLLWKRTAFCISNLQPNIRLQMDMQKDLLELLKAISEKRKDQVV